MSEVFDGYERQYCEISASLSRKCTAASSLLGEKLKQKASEIKSGIDGAEALIRKMDLEARNLQPSVRAGLLAKLREYKSDLNNLKGTLKRITTGNGQQGAREELLESGMADTLVSNDVLDIESCRYLLIKGQDCSGHQKGKIRQLIGSKIAIELCWRPKSLESPSCMICISSANLSYMLMIRCTVWMITLARAERSWVPW
ncbi:unnamed protein product [Alopecurus aequalis]